jgi:hypothetical protein
VRIPSAVPARTISGFFHRFTLRVTPRTDEILDGVRRGERTSKRIRKLELDHGDGLFHPFTKTACRLVIAASFQTADKCLEPLSGDVRFRGTVRLPHRSNNVSVPISRKLGLKITDLVELMRISS